MQGKHREYRENIGNTVENIGNAWKTGNTGENIGKTDPVRL